jgi:diketogulonate reductase-like aldo/keto reductase
MDIFFVAFNLTYHSYRNHRIDYKDVREAFEEYLKELDCEYIDLYLLHWPRYQTGKSVVLIPVPLSCRGM